MIHDGKPSKFKCLVTLNRPSFPGSFASIQTLLRSAVYYFGPDADDHSAADGDLWAVKLWREGVQLVCLRNNVRFDDFVDKFSSYWIEAKALEVELLAVLDREGTCHTNLTVIKAQGCLFKELRKKAYLRNLRLGLECSSATPDDAALWMATAPPTN